MERTTSPIWARTLITRRGLTVAAVARALDMNASHVTNVLNGHRPVSSKFRRQLSRLLALPPDEVFPETAEQQHRVSA